MGNKRGHDVFPVRTLDFQTTLNRICEERRDGWAEEVHSRISFSQDLIAAGAIYHRVCSTNFRTGKQVRLSHQTNGSNDKRKAGQLMSLGKRHSWRLQNILRKTMTSR